MRHAHLALALALTAACARENVASPGAPLAAALRARTPVSAAAAPASENGRLPLLAVPRRYALTLDVDPRGERFSGSARILVDVPGPTHHVVLHARGLAIASARAVQGDTIRAARAEVRTPKGSRHPDELVLTFDDPLAPGQAALEIAYAAAFDGELVGAYKVVEKGSPYVFTQFEATYARRAFPCFDEPALKTPYDVTLRVPRGMVAIANAPETKREESGDTVVFSFAPTPPIPSYLVAFGVGDLETRARTTKDGVPIRLVTVKGKTGLGDLALEATYELNKRLEAYFGIEHPYPKLDIVAVPDFAAGAMENPGFITFREELLLLGPAKSSLRARRAQASVIAHELAHQWFGNLVTAAWWDELWLNEGFASWMEDVAVDAWQPGFNAHLEATADAAGVMGLDALASARAIRQPVTNTDEASEAFDGITYTKGASVLGMLEGWLGKEPFQRGVRDYLRKNAWGAARSQDLFGALEAASGKKVAQVAQTFTDRPGVPEIRGKLTCQGATYHVEFNQGVWRPLGVRAQDLQRVWNTPVCVRTSLGKTPTCVEMSAGAPALLAGPGCPTFYYPNAAQNGYYRVSLEATDWRKVFANLGALSVEERVGVLANLLAEVRAGEREPAFLLDALPLFDKDDHRLVVEQIVTILTATSDVLVSDAARPAYRQYVDARLAPRRARIDQQKVRTEDDVLARRAVDIALAEIAENNAALEGMEAEAARWLEGKADPDVAAYAVEIASHKAGPDRWAALKARLAGDLLPQDRITAVRGLAGLADVERSLGAITDGTLKTQDVRYLLGPILARRGAKERAVKWVVANWDELRKRLPGSLGTRLVNVAGAVCDRDELDAVSKFLSVHAKDLDGAARPLAAAIEAAEVCIALRARYAASVTEHFRTTKP